MRRWVAAALFATAAVALAGCASSHRSMAPEPGNAPTGPPSFRTDVRLTKNVPCLNAHTRLSGPAAVKRFHAVTAVLCEEGQRIYPSGQWDVDLRKVAATSVAGLQRYFEQRSVTKLPKGQFCTANLVILAVPVLVDASGHWLVPQTPYDACHHPLGYPGFGKGSMRVDWRVVSVRKLKLQVSAPALAAHCDMRYGNTPPWAGRLKSGQGGQLFAERPKTVSVCVYRAPANDFAVGNFVRGFSLDKAQTSRLLAAMTGGSPRPGCPRERTFAVVSAGPGLATSVELGGCYRVARPYPNNGTGTAQPAVVRSILGRS